MSPDTSSSFAQARPAPRPTAKQAQDNKQFPGVHMLSDHARILCCAIPINGCSTLKHWFLSYHRPDLIDGERPDVHYLCSKHLTLNRHAPAVLDRLFEGLFSFAFVRDPFARYAIAFCKKFCRLAPSELFYPAREVIERRAEREGIDAAHDSVQRVQVMSRTVDVPFCSRVDYARGLSFREFVDYLCEFPDEALESHWRPQNSFLAGRRWDLVAPLDTQTPVLTRLSELLGRPELATGKRNVTAYTPVSTETPPNLADVPSGELYRRKIVPSPRMLHTPELAERLQKRFPAEFELYERVSTIPLKLPDTL